jgi:xanthine dehydrogenase YagR molybdenum-binding subunit
MAATARGLALRVNGRTHALPDLDPRTTLLDALREHLGLTGTKKGCDLGSAVRTACLKARREVLGPSATTRRADLGQALRRRREPIEVTARSRPGAASSRYSMHAFGAIFAEVTVDPELGTVRVPRLVGAYGAGRIVNPLLARSQAVGGMVMGIGMALMEQTHVDERTGRPVEADLAEYLVPVNPDVGDLDVTFVPERDSHVNPLGVKGLVEITLVGVAAAIVNAVHHATGRRVHELPVLPEALI